MKNEKFFNLGALINTANWATRRGGNHGGDDLSFFLSRSASWLSWAYKSFRSRRWHAGPETATQTTGFKWTGGSLAIPAPKRFPSHRKGNV